MHAGQTAAEQPSLARRSAVEAVGTAFLLIAVVGCVALEVYPEAALLRSLIVSAGERGRGLGERLTAEALRMARERGAREVYLLTETAREFFPRFGFAVADRAVAPASLRGSAEFRSACPASAVLMRRSVA